MKNEFTGWVDALALRISSRGFEQQFETELVERLKNPARDDQLLSKINVNVEDPLLKADLVRALLVLDGTLELVSVDEEGRPLGWK